MKEQTDLPVLVRRGDGRFLRQSDLREDGDPEQFYVINAMSNAPLPLPKGTLAAACDYALHGEWKVRTCKGAEVAVTTVYALLMERLREYTPERVQELAGIHPEQLRQVAELCRPPRKVYVYINWQAGKAYHGDLLERSYCYMLALTGNLGRPGTGTQGWSGGAEFGCGMPMLSGLPKEILESPNPIMWAMNMSEKLIEDYKTRVKMDPTMPPVEAGFGAIRGATPSQRHIRDSDLFLVLPRRLQGGLGQASPRPAHQQEDQRVRRGSSGKRLVEGIRPSRARYHAAGNLRLRRKPTAPLPRRNEYLS